MTLFPYGDWLETMQQQAAGNPFQPEQPGGAPSPTPQAGQTVPTAPTAPAVAPVATPPVASVTPVTQQVDPRRMRAEVDPTPRFESPAMPSPESGKDGEPKGGFLDNFFSGRPMKGVPPSEELRARRHGMAMAAAAIGMAGDRGEGLVSAIMQGVVAGHQAAEGVRQAHMEGQLEWAKLAPDAAVESGIDLDPNSLASIDAAMSSLAQMGDMASIPRLDSLRKNVAERHKEAEVQEIIARNADNPPGAAQELRAKGWDEEAARVLENSLAGQRVVGEGSTIFGPDGEVVRQNYVEPMLINTADRIVAWDPVSQKAIQDWAINRLDPNTGAYLGEAQVDFRKDYNAIVDSDRFAKMDEAVARLMGDASYHSLLDAGREFNTTEGGIDDFALINAFLEILDEGSVKKLSEIETVQDTESLYGEVKGRFSEWLSGQKLTASQRQQIALIGRLIGQTKIDQFDQNRKMMHDVAKANEAEWGDAEEVAPDFMARARASTKKLDAEMADWQQNGTEAEKTAADLYFERLGSSVEALNAAKDNIIDSLLQSLEGSDSGS